MIKLGVFDLDGTLLNGEDRLPESFYQDVELLKSRNVNVAIASGRPAQFLFEMFDRDVDLLVSGEDGNIYFRGRKLLSARYVSNSLIDRVYRIVSTHDDLAMMCTGPEAAYVSPEDHRRFVQWGKGYFMPEICRTLPENAKICKVHVFCRDGLEAAKKAVSTVFADLKESCDVHETGYGWIGIMEKDSNKATAVRFFQEYLGVGNDETAVFGDSQNDVPMFRLTEHSYAMKNASEDVRCMAGHVTEFDNNHNGAMRTLLDLTSV